MHRTAGRLSAQLSFSDVNELLSVDLLAFLRSVQQQCETLHESIYQLYVDYPIQLALAG